MDLEVICEGACIAITFYFKYIYRAEIRAVANLFRQLMNEDYDKMLHARTVFADELLVKPAKAASDTLDEFGTV